jgi:predicted HNH restriction endonuclease
LIEAVRKRRKKIRQLAIEYKGGKCQKCGYDKCLEAMEFHHLDSSVKDFGISHKGYTRGWQRVKQELDKCMMLCANCHREIHSELQLSRETAR